MTHYMQITRRGLLIAIVLFVLAGYCLYHATTWCVGLGFHTQTCGTAFKFLAYALPFFGITGFFLLLLHQEHQRWKKHRAEMDAAHQAFQKNFDYAQQLVHAIKHAKTAEEKAQLAAEGRAWAAKQRATSEAPPSK